MHCVSTILDTFNGTPSFNYKLHMKFPLHTTFAFIFCLFIVGACRKDKAVVMPAFYHWKTALQLDEATQKYLEALKVQKLYVKFFDVDKKDAAANHESLATLSVSGEIPEPLEIIPCVFITNRSLKNISDVDLQQLGERIAKKIKEIATKITRKSFGEVQLDCDWTESTKRTYFNLLKIVQKELGSEVLLSVTIRLHQVKYPEKTGVPPVDKGMLMYYNMGDVELEESENSVLNNTVGEQYLDRLSDYPLPLDMALPLFSWGVVFRDGNFVKLINNLTGRDLSSDFFVKEKQYFYKALKDAYIRGAFVYEGDVIRVEGVEKDALLQAARLLQDKRKSSDVIVSFYHLEKEILERYTPAFLGEVCGIFVK